MGGYKGANMRKLSKVRIKLHVQTDMLPWRNPPKVSQMRVTASAYHSQPQAMNFCCFHYLIELSTESIKTLLNLQQGQLEAAFSASFPSSNCGSVFSHIVSDRKWEARLTLRGKFEAPVDADDGGDQGQVLTTYHQGCDGCGHDMVSPMLSATVTHTLLL